jgi:hypothetical protein
MKGRRIRREAERYSREEAFLSDKDNSNPSLESNEACRRHEDPITSSSVDVDGVMAGKRETASRLPTAMLSAVMPSRR